MAREDLPETLDHRECRIDSSFDLVVEEVRNFLLDMHHNIAWPPSIASVSNNNGWHGLFIYYSMGEKRLEKDLIFTVFIRRDGPSKTQIEINECRALLHQSRADELLPILYEWINAQYSVELISRKSLFDSVQKMRPAPFEPRIVYEGIVSPDLLTAWFFGLCEQHIADDWRIHNELGSWSARERKVPFWKDRNSIIDVVELGVVPVLQIRTEPLAELWFKVTICDFQDDRFAPPFCAQIEHRLGKQKEIAAQAVSLKEAKGYKEAAWYKELTLEEQQRYDFLIEHKTAWEAGEVTDRELSEKVGKTATTVKRWRRDLRKRGLPDMNWHK